MCFVQLGLANNPLECVCDLHWLYRRVQSYNKTHLYRWPSWRAWRCADRNKMLLVDLVDADFTSCAGDSGAGFTASQCEDLIPTTTPAMVYPVDPRLELAVAERTETSVTLQWSVADELVVAEQVITRRQLGSEVTEQLTLTADQRRHVLSDLLPNATYKVCVELTAGNGSSDVNPVVSCCPATTSGGSPSTWASIELVIGVLVGGGLAAVVIVSVAVYCCCAARRRRKLPVSSTGPRPTVQTKRFRKPGAAAAATTSPVGGERTSNPYNASQADVDRAIVESVERLDPESKEVLANLLRSASAGSLDHIGGSSYYPSPPYSSGGAAQGRPTSSEGPDFYEELADDMYDHIPTDQFV